MNYTPNRKQSSVKAVASLKQACQLKWLGLQLWRAHEPVCNFKRDFGRQPLELQKRVCKLSLQGFIGCLVAAGIGAAAMILQSQGEAVKKVTAQWEPHLHLISSAAAASPVSAQSSPFGVQASASKAGPAQSELPTPSTQMPPGDSALIAAGQSPEQQELSQLLRGFLGVVEQEIDELKTSIEQLKTSQEQIARNNSVVAEQLKAAQEQMARDNATVAEQLKATLEQMTRLIAKDTEPRPKTSASPPGSIAPTGKPVPKPSTQAKERPQAREQSRAQVRGRPD